MLLMLIGVVYEYRRDMVPENTGVSHVVWMSLFYLGVLLSLNRYPATGVAWQLLPANPFAVFGGLGG